MQAIFKKNDSLALPIIGVLSVAIPIVVAILLFWPQTGKLGDFDVSFLPHLNGIINSTVSLVLVAALVMIKKKNINAHRTLMTSALALSTIFLVSYVIYHFQAPPTKFGGEGLIRGVYFFILISHIILAAIIVPFVLLSFYYSTSGQIQKHRRISKITFPMWLYVSVTGVVTYLMISPYYA